MPKIVTGKVQRISPIVRRLTAPNPSFMTGAGTNCYILGEEELTVLDPGPAIDEHVDAMLSLGRDRIKHIVVTHTHPDHSPAAKALKEATGAELWGNDMPDDGFQDTSFVPDHRFDHDQLLSAENYTLRAIHTPGHVGNHFCFLLEEEDMLFAGDHLMNGSTVVIIPPYGDMSDYINSLRKLLEYQIKVLAPGHGDVMTECRSIVEWTIEHRLQREKKIAQCLGRLGSADIDLLVTEIYDDVKPELHGMAKMSLLAHLIKLQKDKRACESEGVWSLS
jgi:glyoxylase-like metal-dependent hydrolase (beta-lactamase superfamily II)